MSAPVPSRLTAGPARAPRLPPRPVAAVLGALAALGCATAPTREIVVPPQTTIATFDPSGQPTAGIALADQVWGLGDARVDPVDWSVLDATLRSPQDPQNPSDQKAAAPATPPGEQEPDAARQQEEERRRAEARLRIAFGDAILINADGTITKQYFLGEDAGAMFLRLVGPSVPVPPKPTEPVPPTPPTTFGGEETTSVLGRMLGAEHQVEIVYVHNFEQFRNMGVRTQAKVQAKLEAPTWNSLLLVTARPEALAAFEKALNLFYANIPQVEIEVKVIEYTTTDSISFGVTPVDANTPLLQNLSSGRLIQQITSNFPLNAPQQGTLDRGLIAMGGIHDSWELNALLEVLETNNVADIKSQPKMVVRNGGLATVSTVTAQPFPKAKITNQTVTTTDIAFQDVGIVMDIRPEIAGTETVVLNIYVSVSAVTGFAATEPVPTPIISTREAATSVHLRDGESTVIGGLLSESMVDLESKIPILGDIPVLGYLFRSTASQRSKTTLEFLISPRILWGPRGVRVRTGGF